MFVPKIDSIPGACVILCERHKDHRGFFQEIFRHSGCNFDALQINWSQSNQNVFRGIHVSPYKKVVTCISGDVLDFVVDIRPQSPTFLGWNAVLLSGTSPSQVVIPAGCGHAFYVLSETANMLYYQSDEFSGIEIAVRWNDPDIGITLPTLPTLSEKDSKAATLKEMGIV